MAQKIWSEYFQIGNASAEEAIPGAIIHMQTRDGNDEALTGAVNMQWDDNAGLFLPTDKDNPLEARVRHLEELIGGAVENPTQYTLAARIKRIEDMLESGDAKMTLSGSLMDLRGKATDKPAANTVTPGTTYWSVDTDPNAEAVEVSDGSTWAVMS